MAAAVFLAGCSDEAREQQTLSPVYAGGRVIFPAQHQPTLPLPQQQARPIASVLNVPTAMRYGDYRWNDEGIPPGKLWVFVDLKAQTMSVFRGRHEIGTSVTLYGVDEKPTPVGRFTVLEKRKDHWSNLYDAPMPYMLRLTMDGVAIHGSDVREGAGTHGCLGVPLEFGAELFQNLKVGDEVIIVEDGAMRPSPATLG